jgi:hypothetical protein
MLTNVYLASILSMLVAFGLIDPSMVEVVGFGSEIRR